MKGGGKFSSPCPKSLCFELVDFTYELAKAFNVLPFEIFKQDKDEVIMLINYLIEKGEDEPEGTCIKEEKMHVKNKQQRIRVNDKTATGGWY